MKPYPVTLIEQLFVEDARHLLNNRPSRFFNGTLQLTIKERRSEGTEA